MMARIEEFDVVQLVSGIPDHDVPAGVTAVVLDVYELPRPGFEIEVVDHEGRTVFTGAVAASEVVLVSKHGSVGQ